MSLLSSVGDWITRYDRPVPEPARAAATEPIPMMPEFLTFTGSLGSQPSHVDLLRESNGVPEMAQRAIANRLSSLKPLVKVRRRMSDGTEVDEVLDDHPLADIFRRPHPNFSWAQLMRLAGQYVVGVGESYWLKVGDGLGVPRELHPILPGSISPIVKGGVVTSYVVIDGNGRQFPVEADVIIRPYFPDPESPWHAKGYLGPSGIAADASKFSGQHLREHFRHDAMPKAWLQAGENAEVMTPEVKRDLLENMRNRNHAITGTDRGLPGVVPTGYSILQQVIQSGSDVVPLLDFWERQILKGFGVGRSILGEVTSGDRSSAEVNQFVFDLHTVTPIANLFASALTTQLAHDFDPMLFVEFEPFVASDKAFDLQKELQDLQTKKRSINMVHEDEGTDLVPWGDDPVGSIADTPYQPGAFDDLPEDVPEAIEDEEEERGVVDTLAHRGVQRAAIGFFSARAEWDRQVAREKKFVPTLLRSMRTVFKVQLRSVLEKLEAQRPPEDGRSGITPSVIRHFRINEEDLFDPGAWDELFESRVDPIRTRAFRETLGETLSGLGQTAEFEFTPAMAERLSVDSARLIKHANQTTQSAIRKQLSEATVKGEGIDQIASRIRGVFQVRSKAHARTIARTEVLKASQQAHKTGFETSGVVERKRWNTSLDGSVRDAHATVEGQVVGLNEAFILGDGEPADAPGLGVGGSSLSAGNSINCRCFMTPVLIGQQGSG